MSRLLMSFLMVLLMRCCENLGMFSFWMIFYLLLVYFIGNEEMIFLVML